MPMDEVAGRVVFETRDAEGNLLHSWEEERTVFINLAGRPKIKYVRGFRAVERLGEDTYRVVFKRKLHS